MEELTRVTMGTDLNSLGLIVGLVIQPTLTRIRCAPTATLVFSEIIAMREQGYSEFGYFRFPELLAFGAPNCQSPLFFNIF